MFVNNIPLVLTRAARTIIAKASALSPRLKVSAAFLTLCLTVGAVWIQPAFARSAPAPTPATISLSSIADYFWSFFSSQDNGRGNTPKPQPALNEPYTGGRQSEEPQTQSASPCSPTGVTINVPLGGSIQTAIGNANPSGGDTIQLAAGTYTEQISVNKCVTIVGAGVGTTTILSPATLANSTVPGSTAVRSIVEARSNSYVTVKDLTISGPVTFSAPSLTFGVYVAESATLNMRDTKVTAIHTSSGIDGVQDGQGIVAGSVTFNSIGFLDLDGVTVDDYQKNGIIVGRTGSNAIIKNTTVTGMGPTALIAQNGIQIGDGATATISDSHVNNNNYTPNTWAATGIVPVEAGAVSISNSTFSGNSFAVYEYNSTVPAVPAAFSVTGSTFTNNPSAAILYFAVANPTFTDNVISGSNTGIAGWLLDGQTSTIKGNSFTGATGTAPAAFAFFNYADLTPTTTATVSASFNRISSDNSGGLDGVYNDSASNINAENNWWGCNAGPGGTGCDAISGTGAGLVDSSPWLTLSGATASAPTVQYNGTSNISGVNLCVNSPDAVNVCTATDHIIDGLAFGYGTAPGTAGSVSPTTSTFVTGVASAGTTFTAGTGPFVGDQTEAVGATFDNQTITTNVTVHDSTPPTALSLVPVAPVLTNAPSVQFTATFSEPVVADTSDFVVTVGGGVSGASVTNVACSGNTCTITAATGVGSGTLAAAIPTYATITDTAGNTLGGLPLIGSAFTIDKDLPTGTLVQAGTQSDPTSTTPVHFTVTFTDAHAVSGFDASDVSVATGTGTAFNSATPLINVTGSGYVYDVEVSGMDQPGQVTVTVGAGAVTDAAGNSSADVVEGDNTVYYTSGASTLIVDTDGAASDANFPTSCADSTPTAYTTIQAAINAASNGNTIKVCPGVYVENVTVDKTLSILGPNATIDPNTGTRVAEAIVLPAVTETSVQSSASGTVFRVGTGSGHIDATIAGFTIDGHNAALMNGRTLNGVEVHTASGIVTSPGSIDVETVGFDVKMTASYNIIQNLERYGVYLAGVSSGSTVLSGNDVSYNKFDNLPSGNNFGGDRGRAAAFGWGVYGTFSHNVATRVNVGWQDDNHYLASTGAGTLVDNNEIHAYHRGIFHNLQYGTATAATITNNTLIAETNGDFPASSTNFGIELASIQNTVGANVANNNISGHVYGYLLWNMPTTTAINIAGGTLNNNQYGVFATSQDPQFGAASQSVNASVSGLTITNSAIAGITVSDTPATSATALGISNVTISGSPTGIATIGANASASVTGSTVSGANSAGLNVGATGGATTASCNAFYSNGVGALTSSGAYATLTLTNNSIVGNTVGVSQTTGSTLTANGNYWGSASGPRPGGTGDLAQSPVDDSGFLTGPAGCAPVVAFVTAGIEQAGSQADPMNGSPVHFTVTFSQAVTGLDATKIRLSGTAGATTATVASGLGAGPYDVEVSGMTGSGTIIADLYAGAGFTSAGLPSVASTSTDNTVTYDSVAPTVTSITRGGGSTPTNAGSVTFTVTFSEAVNNVDTTDFTPSPTVTGASISNVSGSGTTYTVAVSTGTGDGPLGLSIPSGSNIADPATNLLGNLPFTAGETYTIDKTGPTPIVAPAADPDNASPVDFTVNFGETTTGFVASDVTIGGTANPTHFTISGSGPYTVSVTGMNQSGTVTVSVAAGAAADPLGNPSSGPVSSSAQFNHQSAPSVSSTTAPNGWFYWEDNGDTLISGHDYVFGPAGGPLPVGSARLQNGASDLKGLFTFQYRNTRLDAITTLKYSTYVPTGTSAAPSLQIGVDFTGADSPAPTYQGRLVYVPSGVVNDTWQTWNLDLATAKFYYSSNTYSPSGDGCKFSEGTGCTLATILLAHPNARVMPIADPTHPDPNNTWGVVGFRTQNNETSFVDDFVIGVNSANTVVNFEPAGMTTVTPADASWFTWDDTNDVLCDNDYVFGPLGGPLPVGSARLLSSTCSNTTATSDRKGLFTKAFKGTKISEITTLKYSTYVPLASGNNVPSLQIGVDFTGNANAGYQGRLVYVPTGIVNDTWQTWDLLANPSAKFYYSSNTYSPNDGLNCYISAGVGCTLSQILTAHPNLRVMPDNSPTPGPDGDTWGVLGVRTEAGSNANVDNIIVGVNSANTVVNFEPAGNVVVSSAGMNGWDTQAQRTATSSFQTGPGVLPSNPPRMGSGSFHFTTGDSTSGPTIPAGGGQGGNGGKAWLATQRYDGVYLADITSLSYSTFVMARETSSVIAPSLQLQVDMDGNGTQDTAMIFEPTYTGTNPSLTTWESWNAYTGNWWFNKNFTSNPTFCQSSCYVTLNQIVTAFPNAKIVSYDNTTAQNGATPVTGYGTQFQAGQNSPGSPWTDFDGNIDKLEFGVNGAVNTYDFEAAEPKVSIADASGAEGGNVQFTVSLTGDTPARTLPVSVLVSTSDGSATQPADYASVTNQVVTFAPGVSSQTVNVAAATDNVAEGNETFTVTLSNAANAAIDQGTATGTITDTGNWIAIGGHVMAYNNGGSQTGIAGVTVTLTGTSNGNPINLTIPTDNAGNYNFNTGLSTMGQYSVAPTVASPYVYDPESIYFVNPTATVNNANFVGYNNDNPRSVTIGNVTQAQVGANVVVPVTFNALGTEQGGSFVLNFDTTKLHYVSSSAPSGTNLLVSAGPGPKTVSFSKLGPPAYTGSVTLNFTFSATPGNATTIPVGFGNPKRVSNSQGVGVPTVWHDGVVTFALGNEGDISNGSTGGYTDGLVDSPDIAQILNLMVGDATLNPNVNEFQRADAGPFLPNHGDGCLDALDLTTIMLFSVSDLPTTPASGVLSPSCFQQIQKDHGINRPAYDTKVRFVGSRGVPGGNIDVQVELTAQGIENGTTFTLSYDPSILDEYPVITLGSGVPNGAFFTTNSASHPGKTAVVFSLQAGQRMPVGDTVILNFQFHIKSTATVGAYPVAFTSELANQRVSSYLAQAIDADWDDGGIEIMLAPTAATSSVGGRVRTADGRGLGNTMVTLTGTDGSVRRALTNQMGYYRIDEVPTGATYVIGATSKRYTFDTRVITVGDNITDADLTPRE